MEKEYFATMDEGIVREGSKTLHKAASEALSASGDFLGSHNVENFENTTSWPKETPNDQARPSSVPSSDARVRWAMMASLAGVRKSSTSGESPDPYVKLDHEGEQPSSSTQENRNRLSNSHESKRPKTIPLGPHIPIRSQSGSIHKRKSSDIHTTASLQEKPDALISNPASIEQYLKNIRNDPNIDDRGLRDGLQSLMLGSGDNNPRNFISQDSKTPTESKKLTRTPDAKTSSELNASPALTSRATQGHDKPDSKAKISKTPDIPVLSGDSYFRNDVHRQELSPTRRQSANGGGKSSPSNRSTRTQTSGREKDVRQSKPSVHHLQDHLHENANQHHHMSPECAPHEVHHNVSARPQPNVNPISATHLAQGHANIKQESRLTPPNNATGNETGTASLQPKARDNFQDPQLSRTSISSSPPNLVRPQSAASQSFSTPLPAKVQHAGHNDSATTAPTTSNYAPVQPLPTPPQTPGLGGAPSLNKKSSILEIPNVSQPLDELSPTNPTPQMNARSVGSAADSHKSTAQKKETDLTHLQLNKGTKILEPSIPKPFEQPKILHPPFSLPNNKSTRQSPAAVLRAQITQEREEKRQFQQQPLSSEPEAPRSSTKIQSDISQREFPISSNAQRQGNSPPKPSNASGSPHQTSQIPRAASNNVRAEHSSSPAAAIRAQVTQERAARLQSQAETQQHQKQHSSPSSDPPVSSPQAMLNLVKDKAKASVDAAGGNPGFIDRESSFIQFPSHRFAY